MIDDLKRMTYPLEGCRVVAQRAIYTSLARSGVVSAQTLAKARDHALEVLQKECPGILENATLDLAILLDEAISAAIDELRTSARRILFQ